MVVVEHRFEKKTLIRKIVRYLGIVSNGVRSVDCVQYNYYGYLRSCFKGFKGFKSLGYIIYHPKPFPNVRY